VVVYCVINDVLECHERYSFRISCTAKCVAVKVKEPVQSSLIEIMRDFSFLFYDKVVHLNVQLNNRQLKGASISISRVLS
jgi:hypothetical protein